MIYDVAIVGAGPAGAACAALCAQAGRSTLLLEREVFPREKVCGDCLNPAAWPTLERLGLRERILALPHSRLETVVFIGLDQRPLEIALPASPLGEIALKRSHLDSLLLACARELGADCREGCTVTALRSGWQLETSAGDFQARTLIAADGRNSTVARLLGLLPPAARDRLALQTHFPAPPDFGQRVVMQILPEGYSGLASVGENQLNLCLVGTGPNVERLKTWARTTFALPAEQEWRSSTPLSRAALPPAHDRLLLTGDATRVVEPFTGEGISYALASGELAARHVLADDLPGYPRAHAALYRGRLWVNHLAKQAVLHPRLASAFLRYTRHHPSLLRFLTAKVVGTTPGETKRSPQR